MPDPVRHPCPRRWWPRGQARGDDHGRPRGRAKIAVLQYSAVPPSLWPFLWAMRAPRQYVSGAPPRIGQKPQRTQYRIAHAGLLWL